MNKQIAATAVCMTLMSAFAHSAPVFEHEARSGDDIVVGVIAERVTLNLSGMKNLPAGPLNNSRLALWQISTTAAAGKLALTFGPQSEPSVEGEFHGTIKNPDGHALRVTLVSDQVTPSNIVKDAADVPWMVFDDVRQISGAVKQAGMGQSALAGKYPVTLQAALYRE